MELGWKSFKLHLTFEGKENSNNFKRIDLFNRCDTAQLDKGAKERFYLPSYLSLALHIQARVRSQGQSGLQRRSYNLIWLLSHGWKKSSKSAFRISSTTISPCPCYRLGLSANWEKKCRGTPYGRENCIACFYCKIVSNHLNLSPSVFVKWSILILE